jgi:hypothetical protein
MSSHCGMSHEKSPRALMSMRFADGTLAY